MKASNTTVSFRKTVACPTSATLLSFRCNNLPAEVVTEVKNHLDGCDFCNAELPLLAHHQAGAAGAQKPPEIPMNLRILAESILLRPRIKRIEVDQN
jgi:hypothetical protein